MEEKYFGRLPKDPTGWTMMTRDGHFGFIDGVESDKVMTTNGAFPIKDVIVRRDIEVGDLVRFCKRHYVVTARTLMNVALLSDKGKGTAYIYDVCLEGWFYPGERVEYRGKEYTYAGRCHGIEVLKNNDGLEYAREENIRALDTDLRLHGGVTPDFNVLTDAEMDRGYVVCGLLKALYQLRKDGIDDTELYKLINKRL